MPDPSKVLSIFHETFINLQGKTVTKRIVTLLFQGRFQETPQQERNENFLGS